jgi:monoamine oxidase
MRFRTRWWVGARQKNFENLFFMFSDEPIPTWWTQHPEMHTTLTGWLAGPRAEAFQNIPEDSVAEQALQSLSNIFHIEREELQRELVIVKVINWPSDRYALGAYSYPTPETPAAVKELLTSADNKLFFAGEALSPGDIAGTVEAALMSGQRAATDIVTFKKLNP